MLDAGCGKGRFAVHVRNAYPGACVVALDLALAMLRCAPPELARAAGSMLELPFPDSVFDAAYATESLEHAVDIERAVAELCRVLRPGGRLVIIDKNARQWGRLETPPWEDGSSRRSSSACCGVTAGRRPAAPSHIGRTSPPTGSSSAGPP